MTTPSNPFVLPGLGKGAEHAGNPLAASMEMMRQAWSSLSGSGGLVQSMPMTPPLSLEDLERRIAELRTVEGWLQMNLSLLTSTIQGLEVQRATISTLRAFADGVSGGQSAEPSPLEVLLGIRQPKGAWSASDKAKPQGPAEPAEPAKPAAATQSAPDSGTQAVPESVASASQAWWNLLHKQFDQLAAATAASMPQPPAPSKKASSAPVRAEAGAAGSQAAPASSTAQQADKPASAAPAGRATKRTTARKRTANGPSKA